MKMTLLTPHLKTSDLDRTVEFYRDVLGFSLGATWPRERPTSCVLHQGTVQISFTTDPNGWYPTPGLAGQLWIEVDDLLALHAKVAGKVGIEWGPEVYSYGRREFAIKDWNGYLLAFSEPACG